LKPSFLTATANLDSPLVLVAAEPLGPIFRAINSYPALAPESISTSPDRLSNSDLADAVRPVLDRLYARQIEAAEALYQSRRGQQRATTDIATAARAATMGAVELLLVDIDHVVPGTVDESGAVSFASTASAASYDVIDEIVGRAIDTGAKFFAVRGVDMPQGAPLAAVLRYAI
jgi:hypothetical protein